MRSDASQLDRDRLPDRGRRQWWTVDDGTIWKQGFHGVVERLRRWGHFDDDFDVRYWRFAREVKDRALAYLREHPWQEGSSPGFLWVDYSDPHEPHGLEGERGLGLVLRLGDTVLDTLQTAGGGTDRRKLLLSSGEHGLTFEALDDRTDPQGTEAIGKFHVRHIDLNGTGVSWCWDEHWSHETFPK